MLRTITKWVTGLSLVGALLGGAMPASAASGSDTPTAAAQRSVQPRGPVECFGHVGYFRDGTTVLFVDWDRDGVVDECFGIGPDRAIWHTWRGAGGWRQMPHNGRADDMVDAHFNSLGQRTVKVYVRNINRYFCSSFGSSGWQPWVGCLSS